MKQKLQKLWQVFQKWWKGFGMHCYATLETLKIRNFMSLFCPKFALLQNSYVLWKWRVVQNLKKIWKVVSKIIWWMLSNTRWLLSPPLPPNAPLINESNKIPTYKHMVNTWTLNHVVNLLKWLIYVNIYLYRAFDCILLSCQVCVSEWIYTP